MPAKQHVPGLLSCTTLASVSAHSFLQPQAARDGLVDLGGHRVHISEAGTVGPIVVFESGLGEDMASWSAVQPEVAPFARTFAYHRPGLGRSDPSPVPRGLREMAGELHATLVAANISPPYVLVGHSLGGAIVQLFAHQFPADVAAVVLVDPGDSRLDERLRANMSAADWEHRQKAIEQAMPPAFRAELEAYKNSATYPNDMFALREVPVILLTGTKKNLAFPGNVLEQDLKLQMHTALAAESRPAATCWCPTRATTFRRTTRSRSSRRHVIDRTARGDGSAAHGHP